MRGATRSARGRAWWSARPLVDAVAVAACCAVAAALAPPGPAPGLGPVFTVLTMVTAGAATGAAILAETAGRIRDEPRWSWVAACFALYGLVVLPVGLLVPAGSPRLMLMLLTAYLGALALLVISLRPPRASRPVLPWALAVAGAAVAIAGVAVPDALVPIGVLSSLFAVLVLPVWTGVAAVYIADGLRRGGGPWLRLGLGTATLAAAQLYRGVSRLSVPDATFLALRLVGAVVVLVALAQLVARSLADEHDRRWAQEEELAEAVLHLRRALDLAAERDHELRNGLAGLAGITHLLSRGPDDGADPAGQQLKQAVMSELGRLHDLLDTGRDDAGAGRPAAPPAAYLVEPVLAGLVALRRSAGVPTAVQAEPGLRACGDSAVLAQVLVNLFANCDRHAPGAAVSVRSYRDGDSAVVEVRDEGPGLPTALGHDLLRRGVHDPDAGGSGLGLHIGARLVHREGGELDLRTVADPRGCLATVRLPAAGAGPVPAGPGTAPDEYDSVTVPGDDRGTVVR